MIRSFPNALIVLVAAGLAGCATGPSSTDSQTALIRQNVATAPADLQLLCSAQASRKFDIASDELIPVGSDAIPPDAYRVDVRSKNEAIRCVINQNGQILELVKV